MPETTEVEVLVNVRELYMFQEDTREVEAALIHARRFATAEPIKNRQEAGELADAIRGLNITRKAAEERKLKATAPYRATTAAFNAEYKELLSTIDAAEAALKRKGVAFVQAERKRVADEQRAEKERIEKEAEAKAADAQAAAELAEDEPENPEAQKLAGEAHRDAAEAAVVPPPRETAPPKQLRGDFGGLGTTISYKHEVVDQSLLPREYLTVNGKAVKAAINGERAMAKAQGRDFNLQLVPGVRIWPDESGVSR